MLPEELVNHITKSIPPSIESGKIDKAWWMGETTGTFTVKSAYKIIRSKKQEQCWSKCVWVKGLPLKIAFFHLESKKRQNCNR